MDTPDTLARAVAEARQGVQSAGQAYSDLCERHVSGAGQAVLKVSDLAAGQATTAREASADEHLQALSAAIVDQMSALLEFQREAEACISRQHEIASQAILRVAQLTDAARRVSQLSGEADILAVNGAIEGARLGVAGQDLAAIAQGMRKLGERIRLTNADISGLAERVQRVLPALAAGAVAMKSETAAFSATLATARRPIDMEREFLAKSAADLRASSQEATAALSAAAMALTEDLQFPDRTRASLKRVDGELRRLEATFLGLAGAEPAVEDADGDVQAGELVLF
jgi:hypothetical protein